MKILVISGFLGAGKTTFIKALARLSHKDFTVLENEYGSVPIDSEILKKEDIDIVSLTEGCICCSMRGDFRSSILTLKAAVDPEYLIIEPTGVGLLSNILKSLSEIAYGDISILKPITIVDPYCYEDFMAKYGDIYRDQIASSRQVVLSHIEEATPKEIEEFIAKIKEVNPDCEVTREHYSKLDEDFFLSLLGESIEKDAIREGGQYAQPALETLTIENGRMEDAQSFMSFLQMILYRAYGDIVRAKGLIRIGDERVRFDVADGRYALRGEEEDGTPIQAVFIGNKLKRNELRKALIPGFKEGKVAINIVRVGKK